MRLLLATAAVFWFRMFSHDVIKAYLQLQESLKRDIYLRQKPRDLEVLEAKEREIIKLDTLLYGLCDADDYWNATMNDHLLTEMEMERSSSEASLFFKFEEEYKLIELTGNSIDFNVNEENRRFLQHSSLTLKTLEFNFKFSIISHSL